MQPKSFRLSVLAINSTFCLLYTSHYNEAEHEDSVQKEYEAELKESAKEALASQSQDADKTISLEKTQVFPKHKIRTAHSTVDDNEKTRLFTKEEFTSVQDEEHPAMEDTESFRGPGFRMEPEPEIHDSITDPAELEEYFVRHFLNRYGSVTRTVAQDARTVTQDVYKRQVIDYTEYFRISFQLYFNRCNISRLL